MSKKDCFLEAGDLQIIDYNNDITWNDLEIIDLSNNAQMTDLTDINKIDLKRPL